MNSLTLPPAERAFGSVEPPGSKSISNRVLPLAALAAGTTQLSNLPTGDDVELMSQALRHLGFSLSQENGALTLQGRGGPIVSTTPVDLFLGNSGTATRILTALLCSGHGEFGVDGIARMRERPIADLINALRPIAGNTVVTYGGQSGFPPLKISAHGLQGGKTQIKGNVSSQFLTGLLLSLPLCREPVIVEVDGVLVSAPYVDLTLRIMEAFGVQVENQNFQKFILTEPRGYRSPGQYAIEPDASSASYFLAAGAIAGEVQVRGLGKHSLQGEAKFAEVLGKMGARVEYTDKGIKASKGHLHGIDVDMDLMSDTGMTLAITALFAEGPTTIRNIGNWRVKETDRIHAMATELRKLGAQVEEGSDWLKIHPPQAISSAEIDTYEDHRMAMCFSLASLGGVPITIRNPECTRKTFPGYFDAFKSIVSGSRSGAEETGKP